MRFTGDPQKSKANLLQRGFDFEFATLVFSGRTMEREDNRRDYGERRVVAIGNADGLVLTLVFTDRAEIGGTLVRRIISARLSNRHEREAYDRARDQT